MKNDAFERSMRSAIEDCFLEHEGLNEVLKLYVNGVLSIFQLWAHFEKFRNEAIHRAGEKLFGGTVDDFDEAERLELKEST